MILSKNDIGQEGASALVQGLQSNMELEYLCMEESNLAETNIVHEIRHWSRLNKAGRRIFRTPNAIPTSLWPHVYCTVSSDANTVRAIAQRSTIAIVWPCESNRKQSMFLIANISCLPNSYFIFTGQTREPYTRVPKGSYRKCSSMDGSIKGNTVIATTKETQRIKHSIRFKNF